MCATAVVVLLRKRLEPKYPRRYMIAGRHVGCRHPPPKRWYVYFERIVSVSGTSIQDCISTRWIDFFQYFSNRLLHSLVSCSSACRQKPKRNSDSRFRMDRPLSYGRLHYSSDDYNMMTNTSTTIRLAHVGVAFGAIAMKEYSRSLVVTTKARI
jgi:hypothetical protein